ncbi:hypothetical protein SAMN04488118_1109 [Epibacterium ulvae]|uniref:Translocase n=1 Tax=Epibacterium ulvae TaxID=1156985 RepID=A0A1G5R7D8_9RHOB|nr:hypothetical protein [Epibacterium ulvae]SCZ70002.1 hypothetical protein SAMN04488118_1109 [Epibacterium ulvae]
MLTNRTGVMAAATLCAALGIGYFMQPSTAPETRQVVERTEPVIDAVDELPLEKITLTSAQSHVTQETVSQQSPVQPCELHAQATAQPGAVVALNVVAPCMSGARLTVHHNGLMFSEILNAEGHLNVQVPALSESAVFLIDADQGKGAVATVQIPDFESVERVVLQWQGNTGFELHAREFGAHYGDQGHVWHGAETVGAGTVHRLGDASLLAARQVEIYSIAKHPDSVSGQVALTIEAEVTSQNCGRDVSAQTMEFQQGQLRTRELQLNIPNCDATGDFLVLNNLVENLKIAQN